MSTRGGSGRPPRRPRRRPSRRPSVSGFAASVAGNRVVRGIIYWLVVVIGALLLVLWIISGPACGIANVTVTGYTGKDTAAVQETAALVAGTGSMVRLPIGDMRRALTRFPGVLDVDIERDWPRSVTVSVTMGEPVAILAVPSGGRYLLSPSGQVMGAAGTTVGLPVIVTEALPPGGALVGPGQRAALRFIGWLPPEIAGRLRNLRFEDGRLFAVLANGLELRIGLPDHLAEKAQALVAVLSQADPTALVEAAYLDIANPRRPMLGSAVIPIPTDPAGASTTDATGTTDGGTDPSGDTATDDAAAGPGEGTGTTLNP